MAFKTTDPLEWQRLRQHMEEARLALTKMSTTIARHTPKFMTWVADEMEETRSTAECLEDEIKEMLKTIAT